eukprot:4978427-Pyramimonas_sp.AAC.1
MVSQTPHTHRPIVSHTPQPDTFHPKTLPAIHAHPYNIPRTHVYGASAPTLHKDTPRAKTGPSAGLAKYYTSSV